MNRKYNSEGEIEDLIRLFETATITRGEWKHAEHLVVALYYLSRHDLETATAKMRDGIFKLLRDGFAVDLTKEMPYHETLTVFWMRTVEDFQRANPAMSLTEKANVLVETYDMDYPLRFYSGERLFSDEARAEFIQPDIITTEVSA